MKIKLYKYWSYLAICSLTLVLACEDLDEDPTGILTPSTFFQSESDLDAAVVAVYKPLMEAYINAQRMIPVMGGDDVTTIPGGNKQPFRDFDQFNISPANNWLNGLIWVPYWKQIFHANAVINNYEQVTGSDEFKNQAAGQAYFLRALAYFNIVRIWGGVPIITDIASGEESRASTQEVYDLIYQDLEFAENNLPNSWPGEPGRATKWAAKSLIAQVAITNAGWPLKDPSKYTLAATKAGEVVNNSQHALLPNFLDVWLPENDNNAESIFALEFCQGCAQWTFDQSWGGWASVPGQEEGGWNDWFAEKQFFFDFPEGVRKEVTFYTEFKDINNGGAIVSWENSVTAHPYYNKYRAGGIAAGIDDTNPRIKALSGKNIYIFRFADVLLMYAEALNMSGGSMTEAYSAVNQIRRRAAGLPLNTPNPGVDLAPGLQGQVFHDTVIDERAWELAGELSRWNDMVRNEIVQEVVDKRHPDELPIITTINENRYLAPIPASEIDLNPNLVQNPGY